MRIYMPYPDFKDCAKCFTLKRLTKMRHDVMQILYMLSGRNHPSMGDRFFYNSPPKKVWGFVPLTLVDYGLALCSEYESRMNKPDPVRDRLMDRHRWFVRNFGDYSSERPRFLDSEQMHKSHRAILARQDKKHYAKFGFAVDPDDEKVFYWPVDEAKEQYSPEPEEPEQPEDRIGRDNPDPVDMFSLVAPPTEAIRGSDPWAVASVPMPAVAEWNLRVAPVASGFGYAVGQSVYESERRRQIEDESSPLRGYQSVGDWETAYAPEPAAFGGDCPCPSCVAFRAEESRRNANH